MTKRDIIRAWKDESFRSRLSDEQRADLPPNPAGLVELTSAELTEIGGGRGTSVTGVPCELDKLGYTKNTFPCCPTQDITCEDRRTVGGNLTLGN